jgi:biotin synthase-like enzyme
MTGDYLTTRGRLPDDDRQMLADLGLELVQETSAPAAGQVGLTP